MISVSDKPTRSVAQVSRPAVLYTRVSSKEQSLSGFSIPAQRQLLVAYAEERDFAIEAEFSEVETAGRTGRAAFGAMIEHLKAHRRTSVVLVEKTDRLYRNIHDWLSWMLRNPLYMGEFDWGGHRFSGTHRPLVSPAVWNRVQSILSGRAPVHRGRRSNAFAFSRLVRCGRCENEGARHWLVAERKKGKYVYYRCERCKRRGRAEYLREETLTGKFLQVLSRLPDDEKSLNRVLELVRPAQASNRAKLESKLAGVRSGLKQLRSRIDTAYDDRLTGRIDAGYFDSRRTRWSGEMNKLNKEEKALEIKLHSNSGTEKLELAQVLNFYRDTDDTAIMKALIEKMYSNCVWTGVGMRVERR